MTGSLAHRIAPSRRSRFCTLHFHNVTLCKLTLSFASAALTGPDGRLELSSRGLSAFLEEAPSGRRRPGIPRADTPRPGSIANGLQGLEDALHSASTQHPLGSPDRAEDEPVAAATAPPQFDSVSSFAQTARNADVEQPPNGPAAAAAATKRTLVMRSPAGKTAPAIRKRPRTDATNASHHTGSNDDVFALPPVPPSAAAGTTSGITASTSADAPAGTTVSAAPSAGTNSPTEAYDREPASAPTAQPEPSAGVHDFDELYAPTEPDTEQYMNTDQTHRTPPMLPAVATGESPSPLTLDSLSLVPSQGNTGDAVMRQNCLTQ